MTTPVPDAPGAQPGSTEPPQPAQPPAPQAPPEPPPAQAPAATGDAPAAPQPGGNADELPTWAQREFKRLRDENATNRVKAKEAADQATTAVEQMRQEQEQRNIALAKYLGFAADEPPTPEQLQERLGVAQAETQAERDRARSAAVELAVFRAAATLGADGNALLDSRAFAGQIGSLDPSAADFGERVAALIGTATEANPRYKLTPAEAPEPDAPAAPSVPQSSPGQFTGANNGPRQWTEEDVHNASPLQVQEAINKGLLVNLGFGPKRGARR